MKKYVTRDFNRAAYLIYLGAELIEMFGSFETAQFQLDVTKEIFQRESSKEMVDYRKYMKIRQTLKLEQRAKNGFSPTYKGSKPFTLSEIARIK